jgi:hypothetical protein
MMPKCIKIRLSLLLHRIERNMLVQVALLKRYPTIA